MKAFIAISWHLKKSGIDELIGVKGQRPCPVFLPLRQNSTGYYTNANGEEMRLRATLHSGRVGKDGVFSARHNDRNFDTTKYAEHIDQERSKDNFYWHCMMPEHPELNFDEVEGRFYRQHFSNHLDAQNRRYMAQRHAERCQTIDDMRKSPRTCPEEVILQIGTVRDGVPAYMLKAIALEYIEWEKRIFPEVQTLDIALHQDEQGGAHIHQRRVWIAHDREGYEIVSQSKALLEIGIQRPDLTKPEGRYNNKKMVFSKICRESFVEICIKHGLDIETEPREHSRSGRTLEEYKALQEKEKAQAFSNISKDLTIEIDKMSKEKNLLYTQIEIGREKKRQLNRECDEMKKNLDRAGEYLHRAEMREAFCILNRERERVR